MAQEELKIVLSADDNASVAIDKTAKSLGALDKASATANQSFTKISKSAANATPALTNFGRVLQDAPFGIIGIANNIDPLIGSFQALQKSTGSTGGALKALFSGLAGPAGIAIGISAVTSALVAFGPQIGKFFASLSGVTQLSDEFKESVGKSSANLEVLRQVLDSSNSSLAEKKGAIAALRKDYGPYLQDLSDEAILSDNGAKAIALAANAIIARARAREFEAKISQNVQRQLEIEQEIAANQKQIANEQFQQAQASSKAQKGIGASYDLAGASALGAGLQVVRLNEQQKKLKDETDALSASNANFAKQVAELTSADIVAVGVKKEKLQKIKENTAAVNTETEAYIKQRQALTVLQSDETKGLLAISAAAEKAFASKQKQAVFDKQAAISGAAGPVGAINRGLDPAIVKLQADEAKRLKDNTDAAAIAADNAALAYGYLSPAIDGVFNALTSNDPFKALLDGLKQFIIGLIKAVAQALILQALTAAFTGGGTAGAGFLGKIGGLLGFRANGGPVNGGGAYLVGESGPELFVPNTGGNVVPNMALAGGGTLTAQVSGNDLLFILNQAGSNRRSNFG